VRGQPDTQHAGLSLQLTVLLVPAFLPLAAKVTSAVPLLFFSATPQAELGKPTQLMDTPVQQDN